MRTAPLLLTALALVTQCPAAHADCQDQIDAAKKVVATVPPGPHHDKLAAWVERARRELLEGEEIECLRAIVIFQNTLNEK